ncbi:MAG: ribonuclease HII [Clostridiales bacterium]|jgi:ribonuclease HII|nr:ribonuclease HII [Clostridiales bacterium]
MNKLFYEENLYAQGYAPVGGVDEAGRGPLAGPVVAAAVVFPRGLLIEGVDDSKKLSPGKRLALSQIIKANADAYGIGMADVETIDRINILRAAMLAMRRAAEALAVKPGALIIDGAFSPEVPGVYHFCLPKADALCHAAAAASILAKVTRDAIMEALDAEYPQYGFAKHKGYGSAAHREAIQKYGRCPHHRKSFKIKGFD